MIFPIHLNTYVMGLRPSEIWFFFQCGDRPYTSESDVYRRQILTYKDGHRTETDMIEFCDFRMNLDDVFTHHIGEMGRFQGFVVAVLCAEEMFMSMCTFIPVFIAAVPDYW